MVISEWLRMELFYVGQVNVSHDILRAGKKLLAAFSAPVYVVEIT